MIPQRIIEKAIAGGWKGALSNGDDTYSFNPFEVALDPTFWQALGKVLGWGEGEYQIRFYHNKVRIHKPEDEEVEFGFAKNVDAAQVHAHRFYDLILQGKPTDSFWNEILP